MYINFNKSILNQEVLNYNKILMYIFCNLNQFIKNIRLKYNLYKKKYNS